MFTDWARTDPRYFYVQGVIFGIVAATMFWLVVVPWFRNRNRCE